MFSVFDKKMEISIVVPAYNEEKRIKPTLKKIYDYFEKSRLQFEIIIVDDGSKDDTEKVVREFTQTHSEVKLIKHEKNQGKGAAVKTGVLASKGNLVLFSDADLSTPIEEFEKLKQAIDKGYDIAIGSRGLPDSKILISQPWYRRYIGKFFPLLVRLIVTGKFRDTQCGFKLFKKEMAEQLFSSLKTKGFAFDVEILYKSLKNKYRVKEIPVKWINSPSSTVSILKDSFLMFLTLFRIKFNDET